MNTQVPTVTVLMPVFNQPAYLGEAVKSILRQTYKNFEFLIIDDGSSSACASILERFSDRRIRIVRNPSNKGIPEALNQGLRHARGRYIVRMDADDVSLPERIRLQVRFMDRHPEVGICGTRIRTIGDKRNIAFLSPLDHEDIECALMFGSVLCHPSIIIRKQVLVENDLSYPLDFPFAEDFQFWVMASKVTRLANIDRVLLHYRVHTGQNSVLHRCQQIDSRKRIFAGLLENLGLQPDPAFVEWHEIVSQNRFWSTEQQLSLVEKWLTFLWRANGATATYPTKSFSRQLYIKWLHACCHAADGGLDVWRHFLNSPLASPLISSSDDRRSIGAKAGVKAEWHLGCWPVWAVDHNRPDPWRLFFKCALNSSGVGKRFCQKMEKWFYANPETCIHTSSTPCRMEKQ